VLTFQHDQVVVRNIRVQGASGLDSGKTTEVVGVSVGDGARVDLKLDVVGEDETEEEKIQEDENQQTGISKQFLPLPQPDHHNNDLDEGKDEEDEAKKKGDPNGDEPEGELVGLVIFVGNKTAVFLLACKWSTFELGKQKYIHTKCRPERI